MWVTLSEQLHKCVKPLHLYVKRRALTLNVDVKKKKSDFKISEDIPSLTVAYIRLTLSEEGAGENV